MTKSAVDDIACVNTSGEPIDREQKAAEIQNTPAAMSAAGSR